MIKPTVKIENHFVHGLSRVLGFRNSFNSFDKSDSIVSVDVDQTSDRYTVVESVKLGENDKKRLIELVKNGDSHAKVNRMVWVNLDLTLPRRVWVDFDTYRIGRKESIQVEDIEYMSESTMHTITKRLLSREDFSEYVYQDVIECLNDCILDYQIEKKFGADSNILRKLLIIIKDNLPESFLQKRSMQINYQALRHIKLDRKPHLQPEFQVICSWIDTLPFADILIGG